MSEYQEILNEPTQTQMDDFRNYAVGALQISTETATQCISFTKEGNTFKPEFKEPLASSINPDQLADLQLYFENL